MVKTKEVVISSLFACLFGQGCFAEESIPKGAAHPVKLDGSKGEPTNSSKGEEHTSLKGADQNGSKREERSGVQIKEVTEALCSILLKEGGIFIFFDSECPICAEYFPTIERLAMKYHEKFFLVFSGDDAKSVDKFAKDYHPSSFVLSDKNCQLQKTLDARVTPEAFVVQSGEIVYSGRIDDRYHSIGHRRTILGSNDLELAVEAVQHGGMPMVKRTTPVGCFLETNAQSSNQGSAYASK